MNGRVNPTSVYVVNLSTERSTAVFHSLEPPYILSTTRGFPKPSHLKQQLVTTDVCMYVQSVQRHAFFGYACAGKKTFHAVLTEPGGPWKHGDKKYSLV